MSCSDIRKTNQQIDDLQDAKVSTGVIIDQNKNNFEKLQNWANKVDDKMKDTVNQVTILFYNIKESTGGV